ncbi:hypothetical protein CEXT_260901 [Caerostris extrusa]|uniref:Uncharacterized protein n=1 Tax=Caerostris extrusa TaxID=172846 RepID=A0AAV4WIZ4_CAEEX|nr:hypothetical protein CEXT_260901 [Caerostris extrusa]
MGRFSYTSFLGNDPLGRQYSQVEDRRLRSALLRILQLILGFKTMDFKTMIYFHNPCSNDARDHSARSDSGLPSHLTLETEAYVLQTILPSVTPFNASLFASSLHCNFEGG